jgi:adenosyl cobinamide kinase/adenosyl cobinamide phosphate guanylyltransferase
MGELVLVTGGARSGKSRFAEKLAGEHRGRVVYLATLEPADAEMRRRVEIHRESRPPNWATLEEPMNVVAALSKALPYDVCVFDCLTLWVSNLLLAGGEVASATEADASAAVLARVRELIDWQARQAAALLVVTNEVGPAWCGYRWAASIATFWARQTSSSRPPPRRLTCASPDTPWTSRPRASRFAEIRSVPNP